MRADPTQGIEWRASLGSLRWLILGALGVGHACGGRTSMDGASGQSGQDHTTPTTGAGGSAAILAGAGAGGFAGSAWSGGAGSASADAGGGFAGTGPGMPSECVFAERVEGGLERCQSGLLHRADPSDVCTSSVPRVDPLPPERFPPDAGIQYRCLQDGDCTEKPYGHCETGQIGPYCAYGCRADSDCAASELCLCEEPVGRCVPAACRSDADCPGSALCASNVECYQTTFSCQQPADQCAVSSDCSAGQSCLYDRDWENVLGAPPSSGTRICKLRGCPVPGRPFLVGGSERVSTAVPRRDWYGDGDAAAVRDLPDELARALAEGWTQQALMEHASVAAFARFVLQLLSLGAPAELVSDASRALQDELRHARDCFRLARRHSPADLGPGPLPVQGALAETSLAEVVLTTVLEGCIGETVAALEAAEALAHCADAEARSVLERIAQEEGEHARLAWRFVAWALRAAPAPQRATLLASVEQTFRAELAACAVDRAASAPSEPDTELLRHGLLSPSRRQALRQRALRDVVAPCVPALLAAGSPARAAAGRASASS